MIQLPLITTLTAGLLGLLSLILAFRVVMLRRRYSIGIGTEGAPALERAVRVHGNCMEYAPLALVLLLLAELGSPDMAWLIAILACGLVLGRCLHAFGLSSSPGVSAGRFIGTLLTWLVMLILSGYCVGLAVGAWLGS